MKLSCARITSQIVMCRYMVGVYWNIIVNYFFPQAGGGGGGGGGKRPLGGIGVIVVLPWCPYVFL